MQKNKSKPKKKRKRTKKISWKDEDEANVSYRYIYFFFYIYKNNVLCSDDSNKNYIHFSLFFNIFPIHIFPSLFNIYFYKVFKWNILLVTVVQVLNAPFVLYPNNSQMNFHTIYVFFN